MTHPLGGMGTRDDGGEGWWRRGQGGEVWGGSPGGGQLDGGGRKGGLELRRPRGWTRQRVLTTSQGRPRGGPKPWGKAISRNRPPREDPSAIHTRSRQRQGEDLPCSAASYHCGNVAYRVLHEDVFGTQLQSRLHALQVQGESQRRGGQPGHTFHGTGGQSGTRLYQYGRTCPAPTQIWLELDPQPPRLQRRPQREQAGVSHTRAPPLAALGGTEGGHCAVHAPLGYARLHLEPVAANKTPVRSLILKLSYQDCVASVLLECMLGYCGFHVNAVLVVSEWAELQIQLQLAASTQRL